MKTKKRLLFKTMILVLFISAAWFALYQQFAVSDDRRESAELHQPAPNFTLPKVNGGKVNLKELKGKAVVVNFWGSWCGPCKREMPVIQKAYSRYKGEDLEIVAVNVQESEAVVKRFIDSYSLTFPVALDKKAEVYRSWEIFSLPTTFFIDSEGDIMRAYEGEMSSGKLHQWIDELLKRG